MSDVTVKRQTKETSVSLTLDLGKAPGIISTGLPFFDHMLTAAGFHGTLGLAIDATGDVDVDPHHLMEDVGIVLGSALTKWADACGPVARFGHAVIPMDDALSEVTIDVSGRSFLVYNGELPQQYCGNLDVILFREFFTGLVLSSRANLHLEYRYGINSHHLIEAAFKAFGRAARQAYTPLDTDEKGPLSTKGSLG